MTKRILVAAGALAVLTIAVPVAMQQAAQTQASPQRAQDQPFPPGSPFALLPGFKIERVTPADKTESLIVVTFDALGRPVVSQSVSGNGAEPRILLDNDGDGIFESEKIVSDKLNTCHGLFYASRTTLYANCRAVMPGDPPPAGGRARRRSASRRHSAGRRRGAASAQQQQQPPPPPPPPRSSRRLAAAAAGRRAARATAGGRAPAAGRPRRGGGRGGGAGGNQPRTPASPVSTNSKTSTATT